VRKDLLDRGDEPLHSVGDQQQRRGEPALCESFEEVAPSVGRLRGSRGEPDEMPSAIAVDAQAQSTGSAGECSWNLKL
jgi:hypothetical protein